MAKIFGWDLNVWNENDGSIFDLEDSWRITAYPFDDIDEIIGGHNLFISLVLNDDEVQAMRLGQDNNMYDSGHDWWCGADYFIQELDPPLRVVEWLESLPLDSDDIPD